MQTDAIVSGETRAALSHENFNALVPLLSDLYLLPQKCYKYQTSSEHMNKEKKAGLTYTKHVNLCHSQWRDEGSLEPRKFQRMGPSPLRPSTTTPEVIKYQTSSEHMNKEKKAGLTYTKHANLCHRQWRDEGSLEPRKFQRMGPSPLRPSTTTPPVQPTQTKTNLTDPQSLQPPSSTYLCPMERPPKPPPPAPT
jgi:hypothetical protein